MFTYGKALVRFVIFSALVTAGMVYAKPAGTAAACNPVTCSNLCQSSFDRCYNGCNGNQSCQQQCTEGYITCVDFCDCN